MFNHCQDFGAQIVLTQQTNRLGIPGFEKFLFYLLAVFSLLWIFYLRHFTHQVFHADEVRTFKIELYRNKPDSIPILPEFAEPDLPAPVAAPDITETPAAGEKTEQGERLISKKRTQAQLLEQVLELYRAENPAPIDIPDPEAEKYRPDDVFDPRLADRIASVRKKNSRLSQAGSRRQDDETYFDNMGVLNYRKGNTCFQLIEIPGIDYQWYAGKCAITHYEMEFEFNGKRY